jgi:hypothetical protein
MSQAPVIISCFYDISNIEDNKINYKTEDIYFKNAENFILKLPYYLIIFIDDNINSQRIENRILKSRLEHLDKTVIIKKKICDTYYYSYINKIYEINTQNNLIQICRNFNPYYLAITYNKLFFVKYAIELNPFNSSHFIWIDFGISYVFNTINSNTLFNELRIIMNNIPDKVRQMSLSYSDNQKVNNQIGNKYIGINATSAFIRKLAGGLFSGNKENLIIYFDLFKNKIDSLLTNNKYYIDEVIMTMVYLENKELFTLYYGCYQSIILNYFRPNINFMSILWMIKLALQNDYNDKANDILIYMLPFFKSNNLEHIYNELIQDIYNYKNDEKIRIKINQNIEDLILLTSKYNNDLVPNYCY